MFPLLSSLLANAPGDPIQFITGFFDTDSPAGVTEVLTAMALSFGLNLIIAQLYKATYRGTQYSQDYVHTLIIIGTVTTALILVVAGNGAIAFGMFAAFSLIRFRRNLSQARDLAFVFFAMATGMVCGARRYEMAIAIVIVVAIGIYVLSRSDSFAPARASHRLRIRVTNDINYGTAFSELFSEFTESVELLVVESVQAGMMTELRYGLVLKEDASIEKFMEELQIANGNNRIVLTTQERALT